MHVCTQTKQCTTQKEKMRKKSRELIFRETFSFFYFEERKIKNK